MTTSKKTTKTAKATPAKTISKAASIIANKAAIKIKAAPIANIAKPSVAVAPVIKQAVLSDDKIALNAAFQAKMPTARPVFQTKFKPLNLAAHKPQSCSDRDNAFISALRSVYGNKPFTHKQSGADSGNLARAINLKLVAQAGVDADNNTLYSLT